MYVDAKTKVGPHATTIVVHRDTHKQIPDVYAANTDEGWFDQYERDPLTGRIMVDNRQLVTRRVFEVPFALLDKNTGVILAETIV